VEIVKRKKIERILVLNRGEIACRVIQTTQEMGKVALAVYSEPDAGSRHTILANEAFAIGGKSPRESYLIVDKLLAAAKAMKADAVHPGYGFLSERADAAKAFIDAGITWIGPSPESIHRLGNKIEAKLALDAASVPTLPWCRVDATDKKTLAKESVRIGYPLLLKAAAGGGGKGMRLVRDAKDLEPFAEAASREGLAAFGDGTIFMERYLENPRHIEVQLLGDLHGDAMHFGERDCSSQRRHQKVIEEAPSGRLSEKTRAAITSSAVALAKSVGYANAGTAEFLVDENENFFFLEMNSRLQVEHTVSELAWGVDLVRAQILVAEGEPLKHIFPLAPAPKGHSIQMRIYAEDASNMFLPAPGKLLEVEWPTGLGIRVDTGVGAGSVIGMDYDPMIAKLSVWAETRPLAIEKALWALRHTVIFGTITNINYLQDILDSKVFREARMHVKFLETDFKDWKDTAPPELLTAKEELAALAKSSSLAGNTTDGSSARIRSSWEGVSL
jgi:acetyl/propionyl-CoA carboxylase alpha subunit